VPWSWLALGGLGTLQAKKARAPFVPAPMLVARALVLRIGSETTGLLQSRSSSPALWKGVLPYPAWDPPTEAVSARRRVCRGAAAPRSVITMSRMLIGGKPHAGYERILSLTWEGAPEPSSSAIAPLLLGRRDPLICLRRPAAIFSRLCAWSVGPAFLERNLGLMQQLLKVIGGICFAVTRLVPNFC